MTARTWESLTAEFCEELQASATRMGWKAGYYADQHEQASRDILELVSSFAHSLNYYGKGCGLFLDRKKALERDLLLKYGMALDQMHLTENSVLEWSPEDQRRIGAMDLAIGYFRLLGVPDTK